MGSSPFARRYWGNRYYFLFLQVLRCFSSLRSPHPQDGAGIAPDGLPHSDICGSMRICRSPQLFAACHVLPRLREPRHPPYALVVPLFPNFVDMRLISFAYDLLVVKLCCVSTLVFSHGIATMLPALSLSSDGGQPDRKVPVSCIFFHKTRSRKDRLQKGGVPAAPSGTATLLRLSPSHRFRSRARLAATHFKRPRLPWLDGRCVQGPGTYSPRHG